MGEGERVKEGHQLHPRVVLSLFTKRVAVNDVIVIYQPGIDGDEVGDKTRNAALEHGAIPADDVLQVDICLVTLVHHYNLCFCFDLFSFKFIVSDW
jgi:hypothetical protein